MINVTFLSIRQSLYLDQAGAAGLLGVSKATYKAWELRDNAAPLDAFAALAGGLAAPDTRPAAIKSARLAAGLTQGQAAAMVGVVLLTWIRWETGQTRAPMWRLALFAIRARSAGDDRPPSAEEVRAVRQAAGLSMTAAADLVHCRHFLNWSAVEDGRAAMPLDVWELFRFKVLHLGEPAPSLPSADVLRAARLAAGLTQEQAAARVYVTRATWTAWEAGRNQINRAAWELFLFKTQL